MNRERDLNHTVNRWLDEGADRAPERFVWAALEEVERTPQRGAWRVSVENLQMPFKLMAPVLGVAAVLALAVAAYQLLGTSNVGIDRPPRTYVSEDLPTIIITPFNAPEGVTATSADAGEAALDTPIRPGGPTIGRDGFIDARMSNIDSTEAGGYVSWAALFETAAHAEAAFDDLVAAHESADGWGMQRSSDSPSIGDESVMLTGGAYNFDHAEVYVWRVNNLVLAAVGVGVGVGDFESDRVRFIADVMDSRTH
jgi:hypothetical protein